MNKFVVVLGIRNRNIITSIDNKKYKIIFQKDTIDRGFYLICQKKYIKSFYYLINSVTLSIDEYNKVVKETIL